MTIINPNPAAVPHAISIEAMPSQAPVVIAPPQNQIVQGKVRPQAVVHGSMQVRLGECEIKMGTMAGSNSFRKIDKLKQTSPDRIAMESAFNAFKADLKKTYPTLERMFVDVDHCMITLTLAGNRKIEMTIGQAKYAISQSENIPYEEAEKKVLGYFRAFNNAFLRSGISTISHYSPKGPDRLASNLGGKPLQVNRYSPPLIQQKQATSLSQDLGKKEFKASSLVSHFKDPEVQKQAARKLLQTEASFIHFQKSLGNKVNELTTAYQMNPTEEARLALRRYSQVFEEVKKTNRAALWAATISPQPNECYELVLFDLYKESYAKTKKPEEIPSFDEFCKSTDARPFKHHAAEVASTLISDPKEYRLFCRMHDIEPKDHHINRFLIDALQDPKNAKFDTLSVDLQAEEQAEIQALLEASKKEADLAKQLQQVEKDASSAEDLIQQALKNKGLQDHFLDKYNESPGKIAQVVNYVRNLF